MQSAGFETLWLQLHSIYSFLLCQEHLQKKNLDNKLCAKWPWCWFTVYPSTETIWWITGIFVKEWLWRKKKFWPEYNETVTIVTALLVMRKLSEGLSTFVCEWQQDEKMGMNSFDFSALIGPTTRKGQTCVMLHGVKRKDEEGNWIRVQEGASPPQLHAVPPHSESTYFQPQTQFVFSKSAIFEFERVRSFLAIS